MDLKIKDLKERGIYHDAIGAVFDHGRFINGPEVEQLEKEIAQYCHRKFAVGVSSGTVALFFALRALGIKDGDEVITTSLSWIATANAIALNNAKPVFADIREDLNIDVENIEKLITPQTKAIMPVHFTGKISQMDKIMVLAQKHNLPVIEDASQSFGAQLNDQPSGSFGDIACFSLNPMKGFAAFGEAGVIVFDDENFYEEFVALRHNGMKNRTHLLQPSLNGRIDTLQAAILLKKLEKIDDIIRTRRKLAQIYNESLEGIVGIPKEEEGQRDIYYTYTIRTDKRDALKKYLEEKGIETQIQHPLLMPQQKCYQGQPKEDYALATELVEKVLCLPVNETLTNEDVKYVVDNIKEFFKS